VDDLDLRCVEVLAKAGYRVTPEYALALVREVRRLREVRDRLIDVCIELDEAITRVESPSPTQLGRAAAGPRSPRR
jgi:hypothetical protein